MLGFVFKVTPLAVEKLVLRLIRIREVIFQPDLFNTEEQIALGI